MPAPYSPLAPKVNQLRVQFCAKRSLEADTLAQTCSGGEEVLLDVAGQDSTEAFEDVGHSDEAREILAGLQVGTLKRQVCPILS